MANQLSLHFARTTVDKLEVTAIILWQNKLHRLIYRMADNY